MKPIATSTSDFATLIRKGGIASGLPIHLIGLSFDPQTRQLVDAVAEKFEK